MKMLDTPCGKCGWQYPGFHVCVLDYSTPEGIKRAKFVESTELGAPSRLNRPKPKKEKPHKRSNRQHQPDFGSEEDRSNRAESVRRTHAQKTSERDAQIARLYGEDQLSINAICKKLGYSQKTVSRVVKQAVKDGRIIYRGNTGRPKRDAA